MNKFGSYLDIAVRLMSLSTALGMLLGLWIAHSYLDFIQHESLFPNIISQPSSFITITFIFSLVVFAFFIGFFSPYKLALSYKEKHINLPAKDEGEKFWKHFKKRLVLIFLAPNLITIIVSCVMGLLFYCDLHKTWYGEKVVYFLFFCALLLPALIFLIDWYRANRKFKETINIKDGREKIALSWKSKFTLNTGIEITLINMIVSWTTFISIYFVFLPVVAFWIEDENLQWWFLGGIIFVMVLNAIFASFFLYKNHPVATEHTIFIFPLILAFYFLMIMTQVTSGLSQKILYPSRFIEIPENSSWYLLHNNHQMNNKLREINGINKYDLEKIKANFFNCYPSQDNPCSDIPNQRQNALYGYMAWNLGKTKVFCPQYVKFTKNKEQNKILAENCLSIDSESIQALDAKYISLGTIQ